MATILKRLNNYTREYEDWCENVAEILSLRSGSDSKAVAPGGADVVHMDCASRKPKIKRLLELMEQAKLRNYPRVKVDTKISSEKVNLLAELDVELKNAQACADYCLHFINVYKKSAKTIGGGVEELKTIMKVEVESAEVEDGVEEGGLPEEANSDDDVVFVKKVSA